MPREQSGFSQVLTKLAVLEESLRNTNINVNELKNTMSVAIANFVTNDLLEEKLKNIRDENKDLKEAQVWTTRAIWSFLVIVAGFGVYVVQLKLSMP